MDSVECYENLRRDVRELLSEENNLVDGDEYLFQLVMANSSNPKIVLDCVRALKEEGNSLFKEGKFDEALEKYGYAGVILVRYNFDKEEDKEKFFDLAICLLLNFTACLGRKSEFALVGQVCTIILEYRPSNVKALFRRAKAAKALGRNDLAYWDLVMAVEIEPKNGDLNKALEEIRNTNGSLEMKSVHQEKAPIGLGISLPPSKRRSGRIQGKDQDVAQDKLCNGNDKANVLELCELDSNNKKENGGAKDVRDLSTTTSTTSYKSSHVPMDTVMLSSVYKEGEKSHVERPLDTCSSPKSSLSCTNASQNSVNDESSKYQFQNRKRRGSFLSITKTDYLSMTRGKTLRFYNSKLGTFMQARIVQKPNENSLLESSLEKKQEAKDTVDLMEESSQISSCVVSEGNRANLVETKDPPTEDEVCSSSSLISQFRFSAKATSKTGRKRREAKNYSSAQSQGGGKRRKMRVNIISSSSIANGVCGCRFETGKKRKYAHPSSMVLCNRPRKKLNHYVCNCSLKEEGSCHGCIFGYVGKHSVDSITYEMAHGQSNRY